MSDTNDEIVGRVLQRLRDTEPPEGMESRIVSALAHRPSRMPASNRLPWRTATLTAGAVLAAGVVCVLFLPVQRKVPQASFARSEAIPMRAASALAMPSKSAVVKTPKRAVRRAQLATASPLKEGLATVSYPAPPMSLTEQEKLLLRLVHKGDPVELAMLDSAQREANYADERAQVQRFFTPPKQETTSEP